MVLKKTTNTAVYYVSLFAFGIFLFWGNSAYAASLNFSPSTGNLTVGNIINVSVLVDTGGQAINNADAVINFPASLLEVISVSKSGSIFTLWVEDPAFSNNVGKITFNGGLPTPGFNGTSGSVINIVFRIKDAGAANLVFSSATVRANDGLGTDVLQSKGEAKFILSDKTTIPQATTPTVSATVPQTPVISSPTHPDSGKWYAKSDATFTWVVPSDVTQVRVLYNKFPSSQPTVAYGSSINRRDLNIPDGVWYFHTQFQNAVGRSGIDHFKFQIDTENPDSISIEQLPVLNSTDPVRQFSLKATDKLSGIGYFEIKIDDGASVKWDGKSGEIYSTEALIFGKHVVAVKAFDKAGNFIERSVELEITALNPPAFTEIPSEIEVGESVSVAGKSDYPGSSITVMYQRSGEDSVSEATATADNSGNFILTIPGTEFKRGSYSVWGKVTDKRGAQSNNSDKYVINVTSIGILSIGNTIVSYLFMFLLILILIIITIIALMYARYKIIALKRKIREEQEMVLGSIEKAFKVLRDEVRHQVSMLDDDKRINESERRIYEKLKNSLVVAEGYVSNKIKKIDGEDD